MYKQYDIIFISTCTSDAYINTYLSSVLNNNNTVDICIVFLLQNDLRYNEVLKNEKITIHYIYTSTILSLSRARNICLNYIKQSGIYSRYIMFPDDDTTFDKHFFQNFNKVVSSNMLIDVMCEGSTIPYVSLSKFKDRDLVTSHKYAMSVNMIIKSDNVFEIGDFDEQLGVGAKYGAGEDGDYFIRVCKKYGPFVYTNKLWNYHPSADDKYRQISLLKLLRRYKTYGEGVIYLLVKHKMYFQAIKCILSGFAGAFIALFLKFNAKLSIARLYGGITRFNVFCKLLLKK